MDGGLAPHAGGHALHAKFLDGTRLVLEGMRFMLEAWLCCAWVWTTQKLVVVSNGRDALLLQAVLEHAKLFHTSVHVCVCIHVDSIHSTCP
eukprot:1139507-Pelagomonas_calceolata.AAC.5